MSNKKNHFSAKGYYIALVLCAAAIGVSGYLYYRNASSETLSTVAVSPKTQEATLSAAATVPGSTEQPTTAPTQAAATPQKPAKTAAPLKGQTVAEYSMECLSYNETTRDWRVHAGLDLAAETGTPVTAAADGEVYTVYEDDQMGMTVVIRHTGGDVTKYASLAKEVSVAPGDQVRLGQQIGTVGTSALLENAVGEHVHFSVTCNDQAVDPAQFLKQN